MNGQSPNFAMRSGGSTPVRFNPQFGNRQPLHLQPRSPYMSPRGNRQSTTRNSSLIESPDFIPLGMSSPVGRGRQSWKPHEYSNNSFNSSSSTPPGFSSDNFSPYRRNNYRNDFKGRGSFNRSASGSPHISLYIRKEMLENPWAELEKKKQYVLDMDNDQHSSDSEVTLDSAVSLNSGSDVSETDNI